MKNLISPLLLLSLSILAGCSTIQSPSLTGEWQLVNDGEVQAELVFGPGDVFHVDLPAVDGVEVKGITRIQGRKITFINEAGTDAISADPAPGTYMYTIDGDELAFGKISDPIDRRAKFLSRTWVRKE